MCPLFLEQIGKDFEYFRDPVEIHGSIMKHLIKAMNTSYVLAHKADRHDDPCDGSREKERSLQLKVKEFEEEENESLKRASANIYKEKKEVTAQTLDEIHKHDALKARFTKLEGENFKLSNKLARLQL
ncbi:hypothetical protein LIER_29505 [Lithospermum erythrorhizon]|uniref:Uncharacterized protein n=1 Tax=Lithospermum erythrorhizon TaxID=34254 RepID=A0AAV3RLB0_LITER